MGTKNGDGTTKHFRFRKLRFHATCFHLYKLELRRDYAFTPSRSKNAILTIQSCMTRRFLTAPYTALMA